jgi:hypothetical protein
VGNRRDFVVQAYIFNGRLKAESCPNTRHGGVLRERRYSSYSFMTSVLDGGEWSASRPVSMENYKKNITECVDSKLCFRTTGEHKIILF